MRKARVANLVPVRRAVALVALGIALPAGAANLLTNPGFESPPDTTTNVDSLVTGWTLVFDCQRSQFHANPPTNQWDIWAKTFEPLGGGVTQNFTNGFTAGGTYNLTSQIFFESAYPNTSAQILVALDWMDGGGNLVGTPAVNTINPTDPAVAAAIGAGTFEPFSISGIAPAGATQVQVSLGWSGGGTVPGSQSVFFDNADLEGPGIAPSSTSWIVDGSGDWNIGQNWSGGSSPNGIGAEADFLGAISANHTVFSDIGITVGTLTFNNAKTYVIAGAGSLTLQAASGNAVVAVMQGTQEINIPTTLASSTTFNVSAGATLVIADPLTISSGKTLTQTGGGSVVFESIVNVLSSAGIGFGNSSHAHQLNISSGGTASIGGTSTVLTVDQLGNGGTINANKNSMVVNYGSGTDPSTTIKQQLTTGYNHGAWNGIGINTSAATTHTGLGWVDSTSSKTVTVKYTLYGDTNLDGQVNVTDFNALAANYNKANGVWAGGDFNYDGVVNASDFAALAADYGKPLTSPALGTLVPEPTSAGLVFLAGALVAGRRKRQ